jgi:arylsulfatase A-like enzyme
LSEDGGVTRGRTWWLAGGVLPVLACGAGVLLSCGALALVACGAEPAAQPRRIVLITLDTLRGDRLAAMPRTSDFAARGLVFESFFAAASATQPTHASLFTGLHPWQHGVPRNGAVLAAEHLTLTERLHEAGYHTAAVVASFPLAPRFGFAQGFDSFDHALDHPLTAGWEGGTVTGSAFYSLAGAVTRRALAALDAATGERQFFFFHYFDPHDPYGDSGEHPIPLSDLAVANRLDPAAAADLLARAGALYDRDVGALDGALGELLDRLDADAARFETHVVITADHGESFGELGATGHGRRVSRAEVQVPLVIVSPRVAPGLRRDDAGTIDVTATVLALAGVGHGLVGRDLSAAPAADAGGAAGMSGRAAEPLGAPPGASPRERFYEVRGGALVSGDGAAVFRDDDPSLPVLEGAHAAAQRRRFRHFAESLARQPVEERRDAETEEALRALGYIE